MPLFSRYHLNRHLISPGFTWFLIGLAFLSLWAYRKTQDPKENWVNTPHLPQEYMKTVTVKMYQKNGDIKNALSAHYWAYSPEFSRSILKGPRLTIFKPENAWQIAAQYAQVNQPDIATIQAIELRQDVVLNRPATAKTQPVRVETQSLNYKPEKQYAETQQFVKMTKPALTITGVGLRAFLENNWVELLHDVKTYYAGSTGDD